MTRVCVRGASAWVSACVVLTTVFSASAAGASAPGPLTVLEMTPVRGFVPVTVRAISARESVSTRVVSADGNGANGIRMLFASHGSPQSSCTITLTDVAMFQAYEEFTLEAGREAWSSEIPGTLALVRARCSANSPGPEVTVTALLQRIVVATSEGIIGKNENEPVSAVGEPLRSWSYPVARIGIPGPTGQIPCTGFLVSEDLLLTNQHCISSREEAEAAEYRFGYDDETTPGVAYRAKRLVDVSPERDYALVQLRDGPGRHFGTLRLDANAPSAGTRVVVVHHPGGGPKQVSREKCIIVAVRLAGTSPTMLIDFSHECDTVPGSSGSPVIDPARATVVGLHHYGCPQFMCSSTGGTLNQAVLASEIVGSIAQAVDVLAVVPPAHKPVSASR